MYMQVQNYPESILLFTDNQPMMGPTVSSVVLYGFVWYIFSAKNKSKMLVYKNKHENPLFI